jgi:NADH-quinone oxidoreductase subunit N
LIPYTYVFVSLLAMLIAGNACYKLGRRNRSQLGYNVVVLALLCAAIYAMSGTAATYLGFANVNPFSIFLMLILTFGALLVNVLAHGHSKEYPDFALLSSFALVGAYLVASAGSLVAIFIGLECVSMPTVFMMLTSRRQGLEATTKFFIMASVAIALLSFAMVIVYGASGSLALAPQQQSDLTLFAAALFLASLGIEASLLPFNVFAPDVYQGSPAHVTAMVGGINATVAFAALMQVAIMLFVSFNSAFAAIAVLAAITMLFGSLAALMQKNFKRMIAYAAISQAGFILLGIAAQSASGIAGSLFQMFAEAFLFIGVLGIISWLEKSGRSSTDDVIGLYKENRFAAIALSVFLLSMIGLPLTTGFVGKFLIFLGAVGSGLLWLAIVGVISSAVSVFLFARVLTAIYTDKLGVKRAKLDYATAAVVVVCLAITVIFGIYPQPIVSMATNGAGYLFAILAH